MYGFMIFIFLILQNLAVYASDKIGDIDFPKRLRTGFSLLQSRPVDQLMEGFYQGVKSKISPSLRNNIPPNLMVLSGFTMSEQDNQTMAGCYIRLGLNLRASGYALASHSLSATSYLNSGTLYAIEASRAQDEQRVDLLISAAQSYYWACCNEGETLRKDTLKNLAIQYFESSIAAASSLATEVRTIWCAKIENERRKLLSYVTVR